MTVNSTKSAEPTTPVAPAVPATPAIPASPPAEVSPALTQHNEVNTPSIDAPIIGVKT